MMKGSAIVNLTLACSLFSIVGTAQNSSASPGHRLADFLSADGTLRVPSTFTSSLDPSGFRMVQDKGQAPRSCLIRLDRVATSCSASPAVAMGWCTDAGNGVSGGVLAIAISSSDVYVGGTQIQAGGQPANRVARWNGTAWSALGSGAGNGVNNTVFALAMMNGTLHAAGSFTQAGGQAANNVARPAIRSTPLAWCSAPICCRWKLHPGRRRQHESCCALEWFGLVGIGEWHQQRRQWQCLRAWRRRRPLVRSRHRFSRCPEAPAP